MTMGQAWAEIGGGRWIATSGTREAVVMYGVKPRSLDPKWIMYVTYSPRIHEGRFSDIDIMWSKRSCPTIQDALSKADEILSHEWAS